MKNRAARANGKEAGKAHPLGCKTMKISAIYQDFSSGIRFRESLEWLGRIAGSGVALCVNAWSFSMLSADELRSVALENAANTDLLIVSAEGDDKLPLNVRMWLDECIAESRNGPSALAELHDDSLDLAGAPPALTLDLKKLAGQWRMDFVSNGEFDQRFDGAYIERLLGRPERPVHVARLSSFSFEPLVINHAARRRYAV